MELLEATLVNFEDKLLSYKFLTRFSFFYIKGARKAPILQPEDDLIFLLPGFGHPAGEVNNPSMLQAIFKSETVFLGDELYRALVVNQCD